MKITTILMISLMVSATASKAAQIEIEGLHITGGTFSLDNAPAQEITDTSATNIMLQPVIPGWDITEPQSGPDATSLASLQFLGVWINSYLDQAATGSIESSGINGVIAENGTAEVDLAGFLVSWTGNIIELNVVSVQGPESGIPSQWVFTGFGAVAAPVPLPAAFWMLGSGFLFLAAASRTIRKN